MFVKFKWRKAIFFLVVFINSFLFAQGTFIDQNPESTEKIFGDPNKKTNETSQAIFDEGGQNSQFRLTEAERGLDFVKKEIAKLKSEIETLKNQVQELENSAKKSNSFKSINEYKPATQIKPKSTPF